MTQLKPAPRGMDFHLLRACKFLASFFGKMSISLFAVPYVLYQVHGSMNGLRVVQGLYVTLLVALAVALSLGAYLLTKGNTELFMWALGVYFVICAFFGLCGTIATSEEKDY